MTDRWGTFAVWVVIGGVNTNVSDLLDLDADSVKLKWGRAADLDDPQLSSVTFTIMNSTGTFTPLASPDWKRGAAVELRGNAGTIWNGRVDTLAPGWGGSDMPSWSRVQVTALTEGAKWGQKRLSSIFEHEIRGDGSTLEATNYWPLREGPANMIDGTMPFVTNTGTIPDSLTYGSDTAPINDGNLAYMGREIPQAGDVYFQIQNLAPPGFFLIYGSFRPLTAAGYYNGLISLRAGEWTYTIYANESSWVTALNLHNGETLTGARYLDTDGMIFTTDEPFLFLINVNNGDLTLVKKDGSYQIVSWPGGTYRTPPPGAALAVTLGAVETAIWGGPPLNQTTWKGTLGRITTLPGTISPSVAQLQALMDLAQGRGMLFRTALTKLFAYVGITWQTIVTTGDTTYTTPYIKNLKVSLDTMGKPMVQALADLVIRAEGGQMGGLSPEVVWMRDALRPSTPELTLDVEEDLDGPPELVFDQGGAVGKVIVKTPIGEAVAVDPDSTEPGQVTFDSPLMDLKQAAILGEDRMARVSQMQLAVTRAVIDLATCETPRLVSDLLSRTTLGPASRVRITGLPAAQVGAATKDSYVLGGELDVGVDHCRLTLTLMPADSPMEARVDDDDFGLVDQCSVAF